MNRVAILVTPAYKDRVRDALLGIKEEWLVVGDEEAPPSKKRQLVPPSYREVSTPDTKKIAKQWVLLFLENPISSLKELHPMARQNISWGMQVAHDSEVDDIYALVPAIYSELSRSGFNLDSDYLRVHTFPKNIEESVCNALQQAAGGTSDDDSYEGPIQMTASRSKCTYVVAIIRHETGYAWNVQDQSSHFEAKFNHDANDEVLLVGTDSQTGKDRASSEVSAAVPVSRAYYKLHQVWKEILSRDLPYIATNNLAVDLGAAPGGWTQVLKQVAGFAQVVAVDQGRLANRVMSLTGIVHVASDMSSKQAAEAIEETGTPISLLVCDACVFSAEIMEKIIQLIEKLPSSTWALPAALVVTLKMPYKQTNNTIKNIEKQKKKVPSLLKRAANFMYKDKAVKIRYKVVHLFANSVMERTMIAIFEPMHDRSNESSI